MNDSEFKKTYAEVPTEQVNLYRQFRATHPSKSLPTGQRQWGYLACGAGQKTLLFLAGGFLRADMWFNTIHELESRYRILATDSYLLHDLSFKEAADLIPQLLDREGVERATLVGLSAGGGLAQLLAQRCPERIEHLVLSHTGLLESNPQDAQRIRRIRGLVRVLPLFIIRRILLNRTSGHLPRSSQWIRFHQAYFHESSQAITRQMFMRFLDDALEIRGEPAISSAPIILNGRVLILNSHDDQLSRPVVEKLQKRFPGATTHIFEEGGHHTFLLYPELYTAALAGFLRTAWLEHAPTAATSQSQP